MNNLSLWEIYVPIKDNEGSTFLLEHHQRWDAKVIEIAGGLSILKALKGAWVSNNSNDIVRDDMLAVRIACTKTQMACIMDITAYHYGQKAVMAYKVSNCALIEEYEQIGSDDNVV